MTIMKYRHITCTGRDGWCGPKLSNVFFLRLWDVERLAWPEAGNFVWNLERFFSFINKCTFLIFFDGLLEIGHIKNAHVFVVVVKTLIQVRVVKNWCKIKNRTFPTEFRALKLTDRLTAWKLQLFYANNFCFFLWSRSIRIRQYIYSILLFALKRRNALLKTTTTYLHPSIRLHSLA